jgi:hypothetical protein
MKLANISSNIWNVLEELSLYLSDIAWLFEVSSLPPTSLILHMGFSNE